MLQTALRKEKPSDRPKLQYETMSLLTLITRIASYDDMDALNEFHEHRTVFRNSEHKPMRFVEFLNYLRKDLASKQWAGFDGDKLSEMTYDLTLDKFCNRGGKMLSPGIINVPIDGSDCQLYFEACSQKILSSFENKPPHDEFKKEIRAAKILQGFVKRHFYWSRLEAERNLNKFWSRYDWMVQERRITVYLPAFLRSWRRREWLENNIDNVDVSRPEEKERIQAIINRKLEKETFVPLSEALAVESKNTPPFWEQPINHLPLTLSEVVAQEKADNIAKQRFSIRKLGPEKLKRLITRILVDIAYDEYEPHETARDFNLSNSTLSRFAGIYWDMHKDSPIPDLWHNVCGVLTMHASFREIARETGYLKKAEEVMKKKRSLDQPEYSRDRMRDQ